MGRNLDGKSVKDVDLDAAFGCRRGKDAKLSGILAAAKSGRLCRDNPPSDPRLPQIWHYPAMKHPFARVMQAAGRAVTC
jgi:hypothetical protein